MSTKKLIDFLDEKTIEEIQKMANRKVNGNFNKMVRLMVAEYMRKGAKDA